MREVLFRGKRYKNGEWVYGNLLIKSNDTLSDYLHQIVPISMHEEVSPFDFVIPETVGQYTGLTVPSGKIFEHDIVTAKFKSNGARYNFTVKYSNEAGCYVFDNGSIKVPFNAIRSVRIIGNIHDSPELLKGGGQE